MSSAEAKAPELYPPCAAYRATLVLIVPARPEVPAAAPSRQVSVRIYLSLKQARIGEDGLEMETLGGTLVSRQVSPVLVSRHART